MKALYLAASRDLSGSDAGVTHTLSIVDALTVLGVEVTLCAAARPNGGAAARFVGAAGSRLSRLMGIARPSDELVRAAKEADIIQERAEESGGFGVSLSRRSGRPLVLEINTPLSGYPNPLFRRLADWNLRRQARGADAIVTQTPISRGIIESYTRAPVYVVPNGADPRRFRPDLIGIELPDTACGREIVAFAGSLRPWHGVEDLIEALRIVRKTRPDAYLLIIGGGAGLERIGRLCRAALGESHFSMMGAVSPVAVPHYLSAARVLVAPFAPERDPVRRKDFRRYGMWWSPVKIFEYMAMGKPIVAAGAGVVPEYLAGAGLTYPPGDTAALSARILEVLSDRTLAEKLSVAARAKLIAEYTWETAAQRTLEAWREILGRRQKDSATR